MNSVNLVGNLATDVELRELGDEKKVGNFLLAVDRRSRDGGADFMRITVWDKQAELCDRYLAKGRLVGVEGRLRSRTWDDADGNKRRELEVVAHRVHFLASPPSGDSTAEVVPFEAAIA